MSYPHPQLEDSAPAVEVAAMLGDSVVGVKHCIDPRGGRIKGATWALAAAGVSCAVASAIAFTASVHAAARNAAALAYWVNDLHKPSHAFRPEDAGAALDVIAFGGLALALIGLTLFLVRARNEAKSPYYRIGTAPGVEQPTLGTTDRFPLVAPKGDDFVFNYGTGIDGELILDGQSTPLSALLAAGRARPSATTAGAIEVPIPARARIRARVGNTTFMVSATDRPRRQATPLFANLETRVLAYLGGSLAVHLVAWAVLNQVPVEDSTTNIDLASLEQTSTTAIGAVHDDVPPPVEKADAAADTDAANGKGTAMALDSGTMGKQDSTRESGQFRLKQTSDSPALAREQAVEAARTAGIMGSVMLTNGSMASVTGTADMASGFDDATIYGGLIGQEAGEMKGGFGYGRWGFGPGAGGKGWGTIGLGDYGTIGHGDHAGDGYGPGTGNGPGFHKHVAGVPGPTIGRPITTGDGLDKAIIRRYIMRNLEKISYCYDKELLAKPGIEGAVKVAFFISPTGSVTTSQGAGFDGEVASCVATVVQGIEFPRPTDGAGVQVNYPFNFHAAGK